MTVSAPAVPALRALSVGEILDASFTLYRRHFGPLAAIALVCSVIPFTIDAYLEATGSMWSNVLLRFLNMVLIIVLSAVATGASVFVVSDSYLGRTATAREAFHRAQPLVGRIIGCSILFILSVMLGLLLFIVPGVVLALGLMVAIPAVVLEPELTASSALSRSWALTKGSKGRMFALFVTSVVLIIIPTVAVAGVAALAGLPEWLITLAGSFVQMFLSPFFYCVLTVAYYDLRVRKEGFDLELLAASLQPA
jgi:hypothetical protein